jgi:spermidine/putrescine transport system permease protein
MSTVPAPGAAYRPSLIRRIQAWFAGRFAMIVAILVLLYLFLPVFYTFVFSFNDYLKSNIEWRGFTLKHWQNPCGAAGACESLVKSLEIGLISTLTATILGTLLAFALVRHRFRGRGSANILVFVPMATPEIVLGASLLTVFVNGFTQVNGWFGTDFKLGFWTIAIAHIMFCISFVVVSVKARLQSLDPRLEEAAQDLYASPSQTFWRVTFPLVLPGIVGAALLAFSLSFDDFIITSFVSGNETTFPKFVYVSYLRGIPAQANVIGFSMFVIALSLVIIGQVVGNARKK